MSRKNKRDLDVIAAEIHEHKRDDMFAVGDLLIEAKASCDHGDFGDWLYDNFQWSQDTAENYMSVAKLPNSETVRNLRLAKTTFYALAKEEKDLLPEIINALAKVATKQQLKPDEAETVIYLVKLRHKYGDLPEATLFALDRLSGHNDWHDAAVAVLKRDKPTTEEAARKIVGDVERAHVAELFAPYGGLPDVPTDALLALEHVDPAERQSVLQRLGLLAAAAGDQPLTTEQIEKVCYAQPDADDPDDEVPDDDEDDDDDAEPDAEPAPVVPPAPLEPELLQALNVVLHFARRPRPTNVGGITGTELKEIEGFVQALHIAMRGGDAAKLVADRAEARSAAARQAGARQ